MISFSAISIKSNTCRKSKHNFIFSSLLQSSTCANSCGTSTFAIMKCEVTGILFLREQYEVDIANFYMYNLLTYLV